MPVFMQMTTLGLPRSEKQASFVFSKSIPYSQTQKCRDSRLPEILIIHQVELSPGIMERLLVPLPANKKVICIILFLPIEIITINTSAEDDVGTNLWNTF
jgi:hypothetical protein